MYRRSKFNEILLEIRQEMSAEADFDVDIFTESIRTGSRSVSAADRKKLRSKELVHDDSAELRVSEPLAK